MNEIECPGLPADWLNSWLASIGLLTLEPRLRLSWTSDANPIAVLSTGDGAADPLSLAAAAWPQRERLNAMPIAGYVEGQPDMPRQVHLEVFQRRAELARRHSDSWTLSSTVTDLCVDTGSNTTVRHAPLDPKGPGTVKWLHHRLLKSYSNIDTPLEAVVATLEGRGRRVADNGLGFDASRISGLADAAGKVVDPVIEVLAFFGLRILPMRGKGVEIGKAGSKDRFAARQRCWSLDTSQPSKRILTMKWPAWEQPLDSSGVDALLDQWSRLNERQSHGRPRTRRPHIPRKKLALLGIHAAWQTRRYMSRGSGDTTVGFTSKRINLNAGRR